MEENRQAYEELTEQLGSYISLFSSQQHLAPGDQLSRSYTTLHHVSSARGHVYPEDTCTLPRTRVHHHDSSVDTSDADSYYRSGFLSLPRHQHQRYRHQDKIRNRSTLTLACKVNCSTCL